MPFTNPILAGLTLIRQAIRSPDYATGSTGWSINRDGSAEFNDVTVRGTLESGAIVVTPGEPIYAAYGITSDGPNTFNTAADFSGPVTMTYEQRISVSSFLNGWVNFGGGTFQDASYVKEPNGFVSLTGLIKSGTVSTTATGNAFVLPVGFRPAAQEVFAVVSNNLFGRVDVTAAGEVRVQAGSNAYVSLSGIRFKAV